MATIRRITGKIVSTYVKPIAVKRVVKQLVSTAQANGQNKRPVRRQIDRRCGRDRRQQQHPIIIDLRSSYARRLNSRRDYEDMNDNAGIDTYA